MLLLVMLLGPKPGKEMLELALEEANLLLLLGINIVLVLICIASIAIVNRMGCYIFTIR